MSADDSFRHHLSLLPRKTGLVLQQLYHASLLSPETFGVILAAGERAGDCNKLLAFAIAYGDLRAAGAPVADTLVMAKRLNVRINLDWGAKRWKAEHDRFSRAETLKRLTEDNVHYDLSKYDKVIDRKFPCYLIRTSRRLGMEGLRQRHCVASYHEQIKAGYCAIASVIIEGERWTVELRLTGNDARPLTIGQIKTHCNGTAGDGVRETIYDYFNISREPRVRQSYHGGPVDRVYLENTRRVLPLLRTNNVARVAVSFDGSGDSGSISEVWFEGGDFDARGTTVDVVGMERKLENGQWFADRIVKTTPVYEAIEEIVYDFLDEADVDWYNDDGGFGDCVIDVDKGTIALDVSTRFTESSTAFCAERDIMTGDPVD